MSRAIVEVLLSLETELTFSLLHTQYIVPYLILCKLPTKYFVYKQ
jgi:hypothetical protein